MKPVYGHLDLLVLAALADDELHSYGLIERLREKSKGLFELAEGTLYPALHRLEREGWLASRWDGQAARRRRLSRDGGGRNNGRPSAPSGEARSRAAWRRCCGERPRRREGDARRRRALRRLPAGAGGAARRRADRQRPRDRQLAAHLRDIADAAEAAAVAARPTRRRARPRPGAPRRWPRASPPSSTRGWRRAWPLRLGRLAFAVLFALGLTRPLAAALALALRERLLRRRRVGRRHHAEGAAKG